MKFVRVGLWLLKVTWMTGLSFRVIALMSPVSVMMMVLSSVWWIRLCGSVLCMISWNLALVLIVLSLISGVCVLNWVISRCVILCSAAFCRVVVFRVLRVLMLTWLLISSFSVGLLAAVTVLWSRLVKVVNGSLRVILLMVSVCSLRWLS